MDRDLKKSLYQDLLGTAHTGFSSGLSVSQRVNMGDHLTSFAPVRKEFGEEEIQQS